MKSAPGLHFILHSLSLKPAFQHCYSFSMESPSFILVWHTSEKQKNKTNVGAEGVKKIFCQILGSAFINSWCVAQDCQHDGFFILKNFCLNTKVFSRNIFFQIFDVFPILQSKKKAYQMVTKTSKFRSFISMECFVESSVLFHF